MQIAGNDFCAMIRSLCFVPALAALPKYSFRMKVLRRIGLKYLYKNTTSFESPLIHCRCTKLVWFSLIVALTQLVPSRSLNYIQMLCKAILAENFPINLKFTNSEIRHLKVVYFMSSALLPHDIMRNYGAQGWCHLRILNEERFRTAESSNFRVAEVFFALDVVIRIFVLRTDFWKAWMNYIDLLVSVASIAEVAVYYTDLPLRNLGMLRVALATFFNAWSWHLFVLFQGWVFERVTCLSVCFCYLEHVPICVLAVLIKKLSRNPP